MLIMCAVLATLPNLVQILPSWSPPIWTEVLVPQKAYVRPSYRLQDLNRTGEVRSWLPTSAENHLKAYPAKNLFYATKDKNKQKES